MTAPDPGLCGRCAHAREQESARGSRFLRCERANADPAYRRYPPLPVAQCPGFDPAAGPRGHDTKPREPPRPGGARRSEESRRPR